MTISKNVSRPRSLGLAVCFCGCIAGITIPKAALAGSKEGDTWDRRLAAALQKMEVFYSEIRASGELTTVTKWKGIRTIRAQETLQRSGAAFKYSQKRVGPGRDAAEAVYCRNPERYAFELERPEGRSAFLVKSILPKTTPTMDIYDVIPSRFLHVSHYVQGIPLSTILRDRSFVLKSMAVKDELAHLSFQWAPSKTTMPGLIFSSGELWFSIPKGWAIEKYHVPVGPRGSKAFMISGIVEYERMEDGIAIPKRVLETHEAAGTVDFTFDKVERYVSGPHDFTLSYYGLPEPKGMPLVETGGSRLYLWYALGALGSLGLAALFRKLSLRVQRS